jgi:hypothetical protein
VERVWERLAVAARAGGSGGRGWLWQPEAAAAIVVQGDGDVVISGGRELVAAVPLRAGGEAWCGSSSGQGVARRIGSQGAEDRAVEVIVAIYRDGRREDAENLGFRFQLILNSGGGLLTYLDYSHQQNSGLSKVIEMEWRFLKGLSCTNGTSYQNQHFTSFTLQGIAGTD